MTRRTGSGRIHRRWRGLAPQAVAVVLAWAAASATAGVRLNELVAGPSTRLVQRGTNGMYQVGPGMPWTHLAFDDTFWTIGQAPFGYGTNATFTTDLSGQLAYPTMTLYLRRPFYVADLSTIKSSTLQVLMDCDSGYIAYINGREVSRKNMGAPGSYAYFDQQAYNRRWAGTNDTWAIGIASNLLVTGTNMLAIQVHGATNIAFQAKAMLVVSGGSQLIPSSGDWRFMVGYHEPSGGIIDDVSSPASIRGREWTLASFPVDTWSIGAGGLGYGLAELYTDVQAEMYDICNALYIRQSFVVTPETAALTNRLKFIVNWDDGYVAYLNGVEIARTNLGAVGTFVSYTMAATGSRNPTVAVTQTLAAAQSLLVPGTNVLAIQAHNRYPQDDELVIIPDLQVSGGPTLVNHGDLWHYFIGTESPVPDPDPEEVLIEPEFADWLELYNDGVSGVSLAGWKLTDDSSWKDFWALPDTAFIPAGGYLTILCTSHDLRSATNATWHTNFKLDANGEYLGLRDASGVIVSEIAPKYPKQSAFHSYGWDTNAVAWRYFATPSPGARNTGTMFVAMCDKPGFDQPGGWYSNNITVTISCDTPGAQLRYTSDGSEPATNSTLYAGGIGLSTACSLRVRAFLSNCVPSPVATRTFLVNQNSNLCVVPAIMLVGDPQQGIFKSNGVMTVVGGVYETNGIWYTTSQDEYHIPRNRGRSFERPVYVEFGYPQSNKVYRTDAGLRIAGSTYTRPRYKLQNIAGTWYGAAVDQRPQFNVYFRSDYGDAPFDFPFTSQGDEKYESIRLRGGHNDVTQPFMRDELARRLCGDTGQPTSRGIMAAMYVNGIFRCYYNPAERYDERFMQQHYGGTSEWDVVNHGLGAGFGVTSGDAIAWTALRNFMATNNFAVLSNYQRACTMLDVDNLIDYLLANAYCATADWPGNNYYAARERSPSGKFRFYMWDAEMTFGYSYGSNYLTFANILNTAGAGAPSAYFYNRMRTNHEFRVRFADRVHKQFFNNGALTPSNVLARTWQLRDELNPLMRYVRAQDVQVQWFTNWVPARPEYLFAELWTNKLWFSPGPPLFTTPGGTTTNGARVTLSNTNGIGTIYYAFDGADPRAVGGAIAGTAYASPITLDRSRYIRARVLDGTNWSAVAESTYYTDPPPLVITEIMYNPTSTNRTEFIELFNAGTNTIDLTPVSLADAVSFRFSSGSVTSIAPGQYVLVVQDLAAFAAAHNTNGLRIAGGFEGSLANGGEVLTLIHDFFGVLQSFEFKDGWYPQTDGDGWSLTIRDPYGDRSLWALKEGWKPGTTWDGTPGAADPGGIPDPGAVVINEVLFHTDASPVGDWVELYNTTAADLPIGGWFLSDNTASPRLYCIPSNTILAAHGFAVFDTSNHFGRAEQGTNAFSFSEYGEMAVVSSGLDGLGKPTGYRDARDFGASEREETFGRYVRSDGNEEFVALRAATKNAPNAAPRVGPLLISEILYSPATDRFEYVQIYNCSTSAIPLYDPAAPTNQWRLEGDIAFTFPPGQTSAPFATFVVAGTNAAVFRARYGLPSDFPVFGPFTGRLDNAGGSVRLEMPLQFDLTNKPYALVERIQYEPVAPWPVPTVGASIQRIRYADFGNDPINWQAGVLHGSPGPLLGLDSDGDGLPDAWEGAAGLDPLIANLPGVDSDGDGCPDAHEFTAGTDARSASDRFELAVQVSNRVPVVVFLARSTTGAGYELWNRFYSLDRALGVPPTNWQCMGTCSNVPGTNQVVREVDATATNGPAFYRARVWLTPK